MPRFFTREITDSQGTISGSDAAHIAKVLRMRVGDEITVCDLNGHDLSCRLTHIHPDMVTFDVLECSASVAEPTVDLTVFMALPKGDKMELIVQKCVELGASCIVPMLTARCVSRPDEKSLSKKNERYQKIAFEAAKQCGRASIPTVTPCVDYTRALQKAGESDVSVLFYEHATEQLQPLLNNAPKTVSVLIGSEGGFEENEVELATQHGVAVASLGTRILRCETAAIAATTAVMIHTENM